MPAEIESESPLPVRAGRASWLTRLLLLVLAVIVTVLLVRTVGRIDWESVWHAMAKLSWWQPLVLLVVLVARQLASALPLAFYVPGVSFYRAALNDMAATMMASIAPPPSDLALRVAMFGSWDVPVAKAIAGAVMNTLTFYIVRFSAPLAGFVLLVVAGRPPGVRLLDLITVALGAALLVIVLIVVRSDRLARQVGSAGARLVRRVRQSIEPDAWATACVGFRRDIASRFGRGFPRSVLALTGMLAAELVLLVLCLRFVGLSSADVGVVDIAIAYLFAYPLTILPMTGLGVVDALILAGLVAAGGTEVEATAVAALIVWRVFTMAGPVALGAGSLTVWRRSVKGTEHARPDAG